MKTFPKVEYELEFQLQVFDDVDAYNPRLITRLRSNYRSLPGILDFFNRTFYNSELLPEVSATKGEVALVLKNLILKGIIPEGQANRGLYFCNVNGTNEKLGTTSWCNIKEAEQVTLNSFNNKCSTNKDI